MARSRTAPPRSGASRAATRSVPGPRGGRTAAAPPEPKAKSARTRQRAAKPTSPARADTAPQRVRASSIIRALSVLGDYWTVLIVRDAFLGVRVFEEFQRRLEIPRQTLVNRLRQLVDHFILYRKPYQERPLRHEYRLTRKGLALYPFVLMVWRWQKRWGSSLDRLPETLRHKTCGQPMQPLLVCGHCRAEVRLEDVAYADGPGAGYDTLPRARARRLSLAPAASPAGHNGTAIRASYIASDRGAHLVLASIFQGHASFEAIQTDVRLASNILAHRLKLLVETGLLDKSGAEGDARRYVYTLTDKGRDIFPLTLALAVWADHWLAGPSGLPRLREHKPCGHPLTPVVACSACGEELQPWDVGY